LVGTCGGGPRKKKKKFVTPNKAQQIWGTRDLSNVTFSGLNQTWGGGKELPNDAHHSEKATLGPSLGGTGGCLKRSQVTYGSLGESFTHDNALPNQFRGGDFAWGVFFKIRSHLGARPATRAISILLTQGFWATANRAPHPKRCEGLLDQRKSVLTTVRPHVLASERTN